VKEIPCNNQITRLLDEAEPELFDKNFKTGIRQAEGYGVLEQYRVLEGGVLLAVDGVWFQSSEKVPCDYCLHITSKGRTRYYHSMAAAALVRPGGKVVLPLPPEMIRNEEKPPEEGEKALRNKNRIANGRRFKGCLKNTGNTTKD
jgi:hypothetical protein